METLTTLSEAQLTLLLSVIVIFTLWDLAWKGIAMWDAVNRKSKLWFVMLLIINSAGIVPILYLLYYRAWPFSATSTPQAEQTKL